MKKQTIEKLDKINFIWLLKQINLGNLIRAVNWLVNILKPIRNYLVLTYNNIKAYIVNVKEEMVIKGEMGDGA